MSIDEGVIAWVSEAVDPLGRMTMRKMMGGATLYLDGAPFAIFAQGELWFKADPDTDAAWDAEGCERFSYTFAHGRTATMNYRRAPADVHDDADEMRRWASLAHEAGLRAAAKKKPRKPKAR